MKIKMIVSNKNLIPLYKTIGSGACDLVANIQRPITLQPQTQVMINTGIKIHIEDVNVAGYMLPRSGKGTKGLVLGNLVGLIDSDYQGEIKIPLWNRSKAPITIEPLDPVVQLVIAPVIRAEWDIVDSFETETVRGDGGFGHTDDLTKAIPEVLEGTSNALKPLPKKPLTRKVKNHKAEAKTNG